MSDGVREDPSVRQREVGVDLAKVVAMLFVVAVHICNHLQPSAKLDCPLTVKYIHHLTLCCVDIFALATGYLCVTSSCRLSRLADLWLAAVFWGVVMTSVSAFFTPVWRELYEEALMPIRYGQYWFFSAYFLLFLFMPLVNRAVVNFDRLALRRLLLLLFVTVSVFSCRGGDVFRLAHGYSFAWLLMLYLAGAYLRLHGKSRLRPFACFAMAAILWVTVCELEDFVEHAEASYPNLADLSSYLSPFIVGEAWFIFLGCKGLTIRRPALARFVTALSATTFGIYLIHVQPVFWDNVWGRLIARLPVGGPCAVVASTVLAAVGCFLVFALAEAGRQWLFARLRIARLTALLDRYFPRLSPPDAREI